MTMISIDVRDQADRPVETALLAVCLWSPDPAGFGARKSLATDPRGRLEAELGAGEWGIAIPEPGLAGQQFSPQSVVLDAQDRRTKRLRFRAYPVAEVSGRLSVAGLGPREQAQLFAAAVQQGMPVFVGNRRIGTSPDLSRDGSFHCKLPNRTSLTFDVTAHFPGLTHLHHFRLRHRLPAQAASVALPDLTVSLIDRSRVAIAGRLSGRHRRYCQVTLVPRTRRSLALVAETRSDDRGRLAIHDLPAGRYTLTVSASGARHTLLTHSEAVMVAAGRTTRFDFDTGRL